MFWSKTNVSGPKHPRVSKEPTGSVLHSAHTWFLCLNKLSLYLVLYEEKLAFLFAR